VRDLLDKARPLFRKLTPVARIAQSATSVLGQLRQPTIFGVVNAVAGGLTSIGDHLSAMNSPASSGFSTALSYEFMRDALSAAGVDVSEGKPTQPGPNRHAVCRIDGMTIEIMERDRSIWAMPESAEEFCRQAFDRALPATVRIVEGDEGPIMHADKFSIIESKHADEIYTRTMTMLTGGRAILLEGRPGVGKTTIAQVVARKARLGRVVTIEAECLSRDEMTRVRFHRQGLKVLSPGVVIVDDIDKVKLSLKTLEMLRREARLVILTANNGKHDAVLDQALMRPARIDEVFTINPGKPFRRDPFDKLSDADWADVCEWPCAYLNEVEKRLKAHPDDLRIDELRDRMKLRTRSGEALL
jgi:hypothetical protein